MFNVELGRKVLEWAGNAVKNERDEAIGFDMAWWLTYIFDDTQKVPVQYMIGGTEYNDTTDAIPVEKMREGQCETAACIAGYVAIMESPAGTFATDGCLILPDGSDIPMHRFADEKLGMPKQGHDLYGESNKVALHMLEWLCNNPEVVDAPDFKQQYGEARSNFIVSV